MGLRERWRKHKERERKINEAIDRKLTPEQKLEIHKNSKRIDFILTIGTMLLVFGGLITLVLVHQNSKIYYVLENHFGENVMDEAGDHIEGETSPIIYALLVGGVFLILIFHFRDSIRSGRYERELERQIRGGEG